jgi:hypothetical protein
MSCPVRIMCHFLPFFQGNTQSPARISLIDGEHPDLY